MPTNAEMLADMSRFTGACTERVDTLRKEVDRIHDEFEKTADLVTRVALLERELALREKRENRMFSVVPNITGAVVGAVVTMLFAVYVLPLKNPPPSNQNAVPAMSSLSVSIPTITPQNSFANQQAAAPVSASNSDP